MSRFATLPPSADADTWRTFFLDYYTLNVPTKTHMVNASMMTKWEGRYETLWTNLIGKYGNPGEPTEVASAAPPARGSGPGRASAGSSKDVGDYYDDFVNQINAIQSAVKPPSTTTTTTSASKDDDVPFLETSTFTVCLRVRPLLFDEVDAKGEHFTAIIPGNVSEGAKGARTEEAIVCTPSISITGRPKIDSKPYKFDHVFGPSREGAEVFDAIGRPLVERALAGQVGVVFAFGQTGSGKTHTMNGIMDRLVTELFEDSSDTDGRDISFSYMEILGRDMNDCLSPSSEESKEKVQVGELLDGRSVIKNLSLYPASTASDLTKLFEVAKTRRTTKATEKNATSSRSHGVGIIRVGHKGYAKGTGPTEGVLYIIDLAGSERSADSKEHSKERMEETKEINLSLMSLKECIRARTMASTPGGSDVHVPYRRSKLTLLMKDVFDIGCSRMCSTVVLAHVSPSAKDIKHSTNTVTYAAPLRVAVNVNRKLEKDTNDPVNWSNSEVVAWLKKFDVDESNASKLLNGKEKGVDLCQTSEVEIYRRLSSTPDIAKAVYSALWTLICDAKVRKRRADGSIITAEQEAKEIEEAAKRQEEKIAMWAEREKSMRLEH